MGQRCRLRSLFANVKPKTKVLKVPPPAAMHDHHLQTAPSYCEKISPFRVSRRARVDLFRRTLLTIPVRGPAHAK
jgi:hypothetical protein